MNPFGVIALKDEMLTWLATFANLDEGILIVRESYHHSSWQNRIVFKIKK